MKISEVYPGTISADYVELQMFSAGQNQVIGHEVTIYDAAGALTTTVNLTMANANGNANPPNSENQRTILIGNIDTNLLPGMPTSDFTGIFQITGVGGAVCFPDAVPADCATWGNFVPQAGFPDPQVGNAVPGGITPGNSISRSIVAGCPSLLEASDDTGNAFSDFTQTGLTPRPNSVTPTETPCAPTDPDTDGDGVPDSVDQCDTVPAATPTGCPASDPADTTAPSLQVAGRKTQDIDKLSLSVTPDEASTLVGTGTVSIPGGKRVVKFKKVTKPASAGQKVKLRFKLAKGALKDVRAAIEEGTRKARLKVAATDAADNAGTVRRTIKLKD
jgi:hypothetical protein